ncbi:MAG: nucleotide exchange factor GrpE [Termitinemataceae bacterium]|nr:MAG: nucleotide exchange factor GrpE [Termitinemataceae bacterium]
MESNENLNGDQPLSGDAGASNRTEGMSENSGQNTEAENSAEQGEQPDANAESEKAAVELVPDKKIAELEAKVAELNDQYLRKIADFENFRKRMFKEKQDAIDFANQSLLVDLIAILDDFDRAITAGQGSQKTESDFNALCEGISMIEKKLLGDLESKWHLKRFDSAGTPFDPNKHEALMMEKTAAASEATVAEEFAKGYMLKDRVVRSAKVKVAMPE